MNRRILVMVSVLVGGVMLAACGSAASSTSSTAPPKTSSTPIKHLPKIAASGTIAAVSPSASSMQVQGTATGETTVGWTSGTKFTQTTTISPSSLTVGSCVVAIEHTPRGSRVPVVRAITVETNATSCAVLPASTGKTKHHGTHSHKGAKARHLIRGRITGVSSTSIALSVTSSSASQTVTLPLRATTDVIAHQSATSSDLVVGRCVVVEGSTSSIGVVTAHRIGISSPTNGSCRIAGGGTSSPSGSAGA